MSRSGPEFLFQHLKKLLSCLTDPELEITADDNHVVRSIFFQDGPMRVFFSAYPELLLLDATYKLTNVRMPVYVLLCIGANGESEVVGIFLATQEDSATLQELFKQFKAHNPPWKDIKTVMTDKDLVERDAVRQPNEPIPNLKQGT